MRHYLTRKTNPIKKNNGKADIKKGANFFVKAFKGRKLGVSKNPFIFNVEELATLWHFPLAFVKTPLIQKIASKRAEPPTGLPLESSFNLPIEEEVEKVIQNNELVTDASGQIKIESDYEPDSAGNIKVKDDSKFGKDEIYG